MANESEEPGLELRFAVTRDMMTAVHVETEDNRQRAYMVFSLNRRYDDEQDRKEMIGCYRAALEEIVPTLPEHIKPPVVYDPQSSVQFDQACKEVIEEAMTHISAIINGTHAWTEFLLHNPPEAAKDPTVPYNRLSAIDISFVLVKPDQDNEEDDAPSSTVLFFQASLMDLEQKHPDGNVKVLDFDPRPDYFPKPDFLPR